MKQIDGRGADVVIELSGSVQGIKTGFEILGKAGRISLIGLSSQEVPLNLVKNVIYKEAIINGITGRGMLDTWYLTETFIQSGKCNINEVLTREFSLDEIEKAILPAKEGNCGKVIINVS